MSIQISLEKAAQQCQCVPLAVVGYCFTRSQLLRPLWSDLDLEMKSVEHSVTDKLQDILLAVLSGCRLSCDTILSRNGSENHAGAARP